MAVVAGVVRDSSGALASKIVRLYRRDTGVMLAQQVSNPTTGAYSFTTAFTGEVFVLAHDSSNDPLYSYVQLLLNMETTAGGTTYTDEKGHSVTNTAVVGAASPAHFGGPVALFNGTSSTLSIADSSDTRIGTGDFVIDGWFNMSSYPASGSYYGIAAKYLSANSRWLIYVGNNATLDSGLKFVFGNGTTLVNVGHADQTATLSSLGVTTGTEHYYKASRIGGVVTLELNGTTLAKTASSNSYDMSYATAPLTIGSSNGGGFFAGTMSGFRQTVGIGRYQPLDPRYGVPTERFPVGDFAGTENIVSLDRLTAV
jgi:hypothetical protein